MFLSVVELGVTARYGLSRYAKHSVMSISAFHESKYHELVFIPWNSAMIKHCRLDCRDKSTELACELRA